MNRLSACLITFNEEHNLPRALESVLGVADEIVVVDCGSRDRTLEIARECGAKVITNAWTNFAEQKNVAAAAASHDWILSLDADEELSPELRNALLVWKEKEPGFAVYEFARRAWYVGGWINHSGWYPDLQRRLYRAMQRVFPGSSTSHFSSRASPDASTETYSITRFSPFPNTRRRSSGTRRLQRGRCTLPENAVGAPQCGWQHPGTRSTTMSCTSVFLTAPADGSSRGWQRAARG